MIKRTRLLNIDIQSITQEDLLKYLTKGTLITPNVDHLVKLQKIKNSMNYIKKQNGWYVIVRFSILCRKC